MMDRYLRDTERVFTNVTAETRYRNNQRNNIPNPQRRDTASSNSSSSSDSSEQSVASLASSNSSVSSAPPWEQHLPSDSHATNYDLACEFGFAGCELRFPYQEYEAWMSHTLSHFDGVSPPNKTVCLFCDEEFVDTRVPKTPYKNWMDRMIHIGGHRARGSQDGRPDFWLVEHMWAKNLLSKEDYHEARKYTEAQYPGDLGDCVDDCWVPLSSKTNQKVRPEVHDLEKEERLRKRREKERSKQNTQIQKLKS